MARVLKTATGGEEEALEQIDVLRRTIDSIGGTDEADDIRRQLDNLLTAAYLVMTKQEE
jgi:hypothetical protein